MQLLHTTTHLFSRKIKLKMRKTIVMMMPQVVRIQNITVTAVCTVTVSSVGTPSPPAGRQSKQSVSKSALDNQGFKVPKKFEIFPHAVSSSVSCFTDNKREALDLLKLQTYQVQCNISYRDRCGEKEAVQTFCYTYLSSVSRSSTI